MTTLVTGSCFVRVFMAVSPRIHWVNLCYLQILDVLSRRSEEVETHHPAMGLHPRSDGTECATVAGRNARDEICGLTTPPRSSCRKNEAAATDPAYQSAITTIDTRRFSVRPARVLLLATGSRLPNPRTWIFSGRMPTLVRALTTLLARRTDSCSL